MSLEKYIDEFHNAFILCHQVGTNFCDYEIYTYNK